MVNWESAFAILISKVHLSNSHVCPLFAHSNALYISPRPTPNSSPTSPCRNCLSCHTSTTSIHTLPFSTAPLHVYPCSTVQPTLASPWPQILSAKPANGPPTEIPRRGTFTTTSVIIAPTNCHAQPIAI